MGQKQVCISQMLQDIQYLTGADFVAVAKVDKKEQSLQWIYGSGSRNERYKRISSPLGRSIMGRVIRSGRPVVVESFAPKSGDDPSQYPIFLAENLQAIIAAPLNEQERAFGVLLVGNRVSRIFSQEEVALVLHQAKTIESALL